jgi:hypothetical protein
VKWRTIDERDGIRVDKLPFIPTNQSRQFENHARFRACSVASAAGAAYCLLLVAWVLGYGGNARCIAFVHAVVAFYV